MDALTVLQPSGSRSKGSAHFLWLCAAILGALGVGLGAFGAHGLEEYLTSSNRLKTWETAVFYHLIHALLLVFAAKSSRKLTGYLLLIGILLFSGSLYALCLAPDHRWLGWITPAGGLCLILSWLSLLLPDPR